MHKIYKLKEMLMEELSVFGSKEKLDQSSLELVDKLAHAIKNIDKIIECEEKEEMEYSYGNSMRGGSYGGGSYGEGSYGGSYARGGGGRGGRSSRAGGGNSRYSRNEDWYSSEDGNMRMELQELMNEAPNEQFRQKIQRMMNNM